MDIRDIQLEDFREALAEERAYSARLVKECDQMVQRLSRLEDHLRTLADYAGSVGYDEIDKPAPDPFPPPPPEAPKPKRKRKSKSPAA